jgi:hypothetical protein
MVTAVETYERLTRGSSLFNARHGLSLVEDITGFR